MQLLHPTGQVFLLPFFRSNMIDSIFILYSADQDRATNFYSQVLKMQPTLHVPGMTEFTLSAHSKLGIMPEDGIARIITPTLPHPKTGSGLPRCELYLYMDDL